MGKVAVCSPLGARLLWRSLGGNLRIHKVQMSSLFPFSSFLFPQQPLDVHRGEGKQKKANNLPNELEPN